MPTINKKDLPLEALRGLAAINVLLWHTMLGFFPQWSGSFPGGWPPESTLSGQVWFGLIHGNAAVILFFVLSGFVLTRRFLLNGDQKIILRGAIKRWPRLVGPVLVSVLASWMLLRLGAYRLAEGSEITGSPWLSELASSFAKPFEPRFWDAVSQGAFLTFVRGDSSYDSSIWTMRFEFIGSFLVYAFALLTAFLPKKQSLRMVCVCAVFLLCYCASPVYGSFLAGVALAAFLPQRPFELPAWAAAGLILVAIYLLGFTGEKIGAFVFLGRTFGHNVIPVEIVASVMLIMAIELAPGAIRKHLSGRMAAFLGDLSFPLYLVHVLVLSSFGCATLIWAETWTTGLYPSILAGAATIVGSTLAAIPLAIFNGRWVHLVNTAINLLVSRPSLPIIRQDHVGESAPT